MPVSSRWARVPEAARAVAVGLAIGLVSDALPELLILLNLRVGRSVPWSAGVGMLYLWLLWRYLGGRGWPQSSADARRAGLRGRWLSGREWMWSGAAIVGGTVALNAAVEGTARLAAAVPQVTDRVMLQPLATILTVELWRSVISPAIGEEAGFRGFMQAPLERLYGPAAAIVGVSAVFTAVHWWAGPPLFYFLQGLFFGVLAYSSRSILPSIGAHAVWNLWALAHPWLNGRVPSLPREAGLLLALSGAALAAWALRRLAAEAAGVESGRAPFSSGG